MSKSGCCTFVILVTERILTVLLRFIIESLKVCAILVVNSLLHKLLEKLCYCVGKVYIDKSVVLCWLFAIDNFLHLLASIMITLISDISLDLQNRLQFYNYLSYSKAFTILITSSGGSSSCYICTVRFNSSSSVSLNGFSL